MDENPVLRDDDPLQEARRLRERSSRTRQGLGTVVAALVEERLRARQTVMAMSEASLALPKRVDGPIEEPPEKI